MRRVEDDRQAAQDDMQPTGDDNPLTTEQIAHAADDRPTRAAADQTATDQADAYQADAYQTGADQTAAGQTGAYQTGANQMGSGHMGSGQLAADEMAADETMNRAGGGSQQAQVQSQQAPAQRAQLLRPDEQQEVTGRWREIQAAFVDEPRQAVSDADALVASLMQQLAQMFAAEREQLEAQWAAGGDVSTEDLRQGLQRYRSFFERLLTA